jgi:hypothetical protein
VADLYLSCFRLAGRSSIYSASPATPLISVFFALRLCRFNLLFSAFCLAGSRGKTRMAQIIHHTTLKHLYIFTGEISYDVCDVDPEHYSCQLKQQSECPRILSIITCPYPKTNGKGRKVATENKCLTRSATDCECPETSSIFLHK